MLIKNPLTEQYKKHTEQVSLEKLYELLGIQPTPMQLGVIDLWDSRLHDFSEVNISASRRQGKTATCAILVVRELLVINSTTLVISKSAKSVAVLFNEVLRLIRSLGLKPTKVNSNQYSLQLNDSILRCTVHKTMETLLGNKASLLVFDECGTYSYKEDADINLLPMRADYQTWSDTNQFVSKIVRVSSPREIGSDFYYDFIKGLVGKPIGMGRGDVYISPKGTCSISFSIYDSPLATPELINSLKETTGEEEWKTEYLAEFIHMNSISAFNQFSEDRHTFKLSELSKRVGSTGFGVLGLDMSSSRLSGFVGLDVGFRDNSAIVIGTIIDDSIYILDAFEQSYLTSKEFAAEISKMMAKWELGTIPLDFDEGAIYIDKTAAMMTADLNNTYDIPAIPGFNKVRDGISLMNAAFSANKLFINEDLTFLIDQVKTLAFKESIIGSLTAGSSGDPFVRVKGHHFDVVHAMRYLCASVITYWGYARVYDEEY